VMTKLDEVIAATDGVDGPPPELEQANADLAAVTEEMQRLFQRRPWNLDAMEAQLDKADAACAVAESIPAAMAQPEFRASLLEGKQARADLRQSIARVRADGGDPGPTVSAGGGGGGGRLRECYLCGTSFRGDGYRRWVTTSRNNWSSVGWSRRGSYRTGSGARTGLRTVCASCAKQLDKGGGVGTVVGLILTGLVILGGVAMCNGSSHTSTPTTSYKTTDDAPSTPAYTPPPAPAYVPPALPSRNTLPRCSATVTDRCWSG
jgi:hypothetical protein